MDVLRPDFQRAGTVPWRLRGADALHLAVALRIGATGMLTYDDELAEAATSLGLAAIRPEVT